MPFGQQNVSLDDLTVVFLDFFPFQSETLPHHANSHYIWTVLVLC